METLRKAAIEKAATKYLDGGYDAYKILQDASANGKGERRANEFVDVHSPLVSLSTYEMLELITATADGIECPKFIANIDWKLLREQKKTIEHIIDHVSNDADIDDHLEGVLNLFDALQDYAVDELGFSDEEVFDFDDDDYGDCDYCDKKCWRSINKLGG
jgi:hypothetical protein